MQLPRDDFDWYDAENLTVPEQAAISVYTNQAGDIVIRQRGEWDDPGDTYIIVRPENAEVLIRAILAEIPPTIRRLPADQFPTGGGTTGANRSRRYRERKRHAITHVTRDGGCDADRDGVTLFAQNGAADGSSTG